MKIIKIKVFAGMVVGMLFLPVMARAAESTDGTMNTPTPASSTPATTPPKHHHKHKKTATSSKIPTSTVVPSVAPVSGASNSDASKPGDGAPVPNGMADSLGNNNAGSPNMGTQDHTPGTTGTSGQ